MEEKFIAVWAANREKSESLGVRMRPIPAGEAMKTAHRALSGSRLSDGFNALKEEYVDMVKAGIVDPAKVTRTALQNAASIAALVLTTETLVADKPEPAPAAPAAPAGMGGGMPGMM